VSADGDLAPAGSCELCRRGVSVLTKHHLIPRTRHRNRRNKREFDRREVRERIALLCRPCHKQVHALLDEKVLEREFNTVEALAAHPGVARFVAWIEKRPDGTPVTTFHAAEKRRKRNVRLP